MSKTRPNILFFFTDDQRYDTIHALGCALIHTPNIDRLVESGVSFSHAHIPGGTVAAVCMPSRGMLHTGRTLFHLQGAGEEIPPEHTLLGEHLQRHGYRTYGTGKWHNGPAAYARAFTHGDKIFFGGMSDHLKVPVHDFSPDGKYPKATQTIAKEFSSELFSDAAVRFLRDAPQDRPFLAYVAYTAPHDPRMPPKQYADMYDPAKLPVPANFLPEHPFDNGDLRLRDEKLAPWPRTPEIVREHLAAYYGMISHLDAQIGRVLDALEAAGHADDTIIVFAGDNGLAVGRHGLLGKQNMYEHSVRVPLVVCAPGVGSPGARCHSLVHLHDVFPTVCDLAGVPVPASVESKSLAPLLADPAARIYDDVYAAYRDVQRMVRNERWKLIVYPKAGVTQLFDIQADPLEMQNLAADPSQAERITQMKVRLKAWAERTGDGLAAAALL
jgi:arylsulfatase A-like enzyme